MAELAFCKTKTCKQGVLGMQPIDNFYRAMLCIAGAMLSQDVRLSVTRRYSVETAKSIVKLLPSGSHTILDFLY